MPGINKPSLSELFPEGGRLLLTGGGKEFIERIGVEAARRVVLHVMMGENLRDQTEPLTRRRVALTSGALIALFARGALEIESFISQVTPLAVEQIAISKRSDNASVWPAQWLIGLTGKSVQNVLRGKSETMARYLNDFEAALEDVAERCRNEMGDLRMTLGFVSDPSGRVAELDWKGITRLTTAIGSQTLTIRGSDKSIYGKLFERLILGSFLTILGFERIDRSASARTKKVFWLSDATDERESDATLLVRPGKLARFDIGFIGPGNPEISKDKLSRYARELETAGGRSPSVTFIIVDRLPRIGTTERAAKSIGAEIVQMSMQYWPRDLAQRLGKRLGIRHELQKMADKEIGDYLAKKLDTIPIQNFLTGLSSQSLEKDAALPPAEREIEPFEDD